MAESTTPDVKYTGLYFTELQRLLRLYRRQNLPGFDDEDTHEPLTQIEDAIALMGHYMGVLLDMVAMESLFGMAKLRESVRDHLALIGEKLAQATPGVVDLLCKLPSPLAASATLSKLALFSTNPSASLAAIPFETQADKTITRTDRVTACYEDDGGAFTDRTTKANTDADTFQIWGGVPVAADALYVGHDSAFWDKLVVKTTVLGDIWDLTEFAFEVYDGQNQDVNPTSVAVGGGLPAGTMRLNLTSLLGTNNRKGLTIVITSTTSGQQASKTSDWIGAVNVVDVTISDLGLSVESSTATDFIVGCVWKEPPGLAVSTSGTTATISFSVPETTTRKWPAANLKTVLGGNAPSLSMHWMRIRCVVAGGTAPTVDRTLINQAGQYFLVSATQGTTIVEPVFGTSTGGALQAFVSSNEGVIEDSVVIEVDEGDGFKTWTEIDDWLTSQSTDKHFRVVYDPDGTAIVEFGDGVNGKIPVTGATIKVTYRIEADSDGNVGAGTVVVNRSGFALVSTVTNPRAGTGWRMAEGATQADLELQKIEKPANLRALARVVSETDAQSVARNWKDSLGAKPWARATVIDENSGPKTAAVVLVESGSAPAPAATYTSFQTYLNGDLATGVWGVGILNYEFTARRYTPVTVTVTMTTKGGVKATIEAAIQAYLQPLHQESDGTYTFDFAGKVYADQLTYIAIASGAKNVPSLTINGVPDGDVTLAAEALPVAGVITVTVT